MLVDFLFELRRRKVHAGPLEWQTLMEALDQGLHDSSLTGFYHVARAVLVHRESDLDAFDETFAEFFRGIEAGSTWLKEQLAEWLANPKLLEQMDPALLASLSPLELETLRKMFEQRMREQTERHDGGSRWIGTGGTSPFGQGGQHPSGIRVGGASQFRSAVKVAEERRYRAYRKDLVLDVRQFGVALRKLRQLRREGGEEELDLEGTIDRTSRNAGELEILMRPPRKSNIRVLLLMDIGGSMDPFTRIVSMLLTAATKATHFRELRTLYFHNCIYGKLYKNEQFDEWMNVDDVLREVGRAWKLILVGDALMNPAELLQVGGSIDYYQRNAVPGLVWLQTLADYFRKAAWINPEPPAYWRQGTCEMIGKIFPMYPLTAEGIEQAADFLTRARTA